MIELALSEIRGFVRTAIDEIQVNESSFVPSDGLSYADDEDMNTIIDSKVIEAVTYVHKNSPTSLLLDAKKFVADSSNTKIEDKEVTVTIPDMMRLVLLKASDSDKVILEYVGEDDPIALMQSDKYCKSTYEDPVLVLSHNGDSKILTYYSLKESTTNVNVFDKVLYIPYPEISDNKIQVCKDAKLAILNHTTGLVLLVYKDEHAESFFNQAKTYMQ